MPGIIELPQNALPLYFSSYIQTYVERDIQLLENIEDLAAFGPLVPNFYHWRSLAGAEVDIIVELDGKFYPIEVKSATTISKHDVKGIIAFKYRAGDRYICRRSLLSITEDIVAVPWGTY